MGTTQQVQREESLFAQDPIASLSADLRNLPVKNSASSRAILVYWLGPNKLTPCSVSTLAVSGAIVVPGTTDPRPEPRAKGSAVERRAGRRGTRRGALTHGPRTEVGINAEAILPVFIPPCPSLGSTRIVLKLCLHLTLVAINGMATIDVWHKLETSPQSTLCKRSANRSKMAIGLRLLRIGKKGAGRRALFVLASKVGKRYDVISAALHRGRQTDLASGPWRGRGGA